MVSSINGKTYRRPIQAAVAARLAAVSEEIDLASIEDGRALAGVSLYDENGNPKHHDESANPGLDDARFHVLWPGGSIGLARDGAPRTHGVVER